MSNGNPTRFVDLQRQYHCIKGEVDAALSRVLEKTDFILGSEVTQFENAFAAYCNTKHCVGVASGTEALWLALRASNVGRGNEVIVPGNTFIATAEAVVAAGAKPVFVDVDKETYNIDVTSARKAVTTKTKAIIPVHLYGQCADMAAVNELATEKNLLVIEDACQAHGAEHRGKRAGSMGKAGCYSFYAGKNLGAYGDGGAITTNDTELAEKLRVLRIFGQKEKNVHSFKGWNSRLDTLQAAVLNVKLKRLEEWTESRRKHASRYNELLAGIPNVKTPSENPYNRHVYHLYVIQCEQRDKLREHLGNQGIDTGIHYPAPIHKTPAYAEYASTKLPVCEAHAPKLLSLPMFPELRADEIERVCAEIKAFYR